MNMAIKALGDLILYVRMFAWSDTSILFEFYAGHFHEFQKNDCLEKMAKHIRSVLFITGLILTLILL